MTAFFERFKKLGVSLLGLAALAIIVLIQIADPEPLSRIRMFVFDTYQVIAPRTAETPEKVAIVDIDEESIERLGQWPWPRADLAQMTQRLGEAGASTVVFDVVFSETDRTSPEAVAARLEAEGRSATLTSQLADLPSHDSQLAASFENVPVVTGYFLDRKERGRDVEPKNGFTLSGSMPFEHVAEYQGALQPLPDLEEAAAGSGFVSLESDSDGIVRRVPLVAIHRDTLIPALSLEALRVNWDAGSPSLLASDGSGESLDRPGAAVSIRLGDRVIPVTDAGEMWVHYPEPGTRSVVSAAPIITGDLSDSRLAAELGGKIVLIGGSATGLQDLVSTPVSERIAGVTVHAAALDQMLDGHFLQRPDWAFGFELMLVLLIGVAFALLLPRLGALLGALAAGGGIIAIFAVSWLGFSQAQYLLDPTYPAMAFAVIYSIQTVAVYYREERQRSYIHSAFDRFLSPEMVRQIAADPGKLELGGQERDMSVLMCDIRGFSRISEQYSPREVIDFLISFLTPMSEILLDHKATLDKYIGDAILAFWNAPLDDPDHHKNAARAALAMTEKLVELNAIYPNSRSVVWPGEVQLGIGLNSGLCCVGNMGSEQRLAYSLIGDTVNVAARLEGLTKQYGVQIIVGEDIARELTGFALVELDRVRVVGRQSAERIFVLLGDELTAQGETFSRFAKAHSEVLEAYQMQDWNAALSQLEENLESYSEAGVPKLAELFRSRIERLAQDPPGSGWDGVFEVTRK